MAEIKKANKSDQIVHLAYIVEFTAGYPKDYKGKKFMKDGKVYNLHKLHAERLAKKGFGKITKDVPPKQVAE